MAKQKVFHGGTIDVVTPEEAAEMLAAREPNIVLGLGGSQVEEVQPDMPMRGTLRQLTSFDRGDGADNLAIPPAVFTLLCQHNASRVAGSLINTGVNPLYVYLGKMSRAQNQGFGAVSGIFVGVLATQWSNFDFKITNDVWCGPVILYSPLGTTVAWGEH